MRNPIIIGAALLMLCVSIFAGIIYFWLHLPSDDSIIATFRSHRTEFDKILTMVRDDRAHGWIPAHPVRIDPSWGRPDKVDSRTKEMPLERFDEYVRLFHSIGLRHGLTVGSGEEVTFNFAVRGLLVIAPCTYVGIVYKPDKRGREIVDSLSEKRLPQKDGHIAAGLYLRPIESEPDWFVYRYEFD